ncbi:MAG TPA: hypothetical protein DIW47_10355 [Bacteroidetes bacterium]|nr:hypothetical protein [Bacteroidota bacterium]
MNLTRIISSVFLSLFCFSAWADPDLSGVYEIIIFIAGIQILIGIIGIWAAINFLRKGKKLNLIISLFVAVLSMTYMVMLELGGNETQGPFSLLIRTMDLAFPSEAVLAGFLSVLILAILLFKLRSMLPVSPWVYGFLNMVILTGLAWINMPGLQVLTGLGYICFSHVLSREIVKKDSEVMMKVVLGKVNAYYLICVVAFILFFDLLYHPLSGWVPSPITMFRSFLYSLILPAVLCNLSSFISLFYWSWTLHKNGEN